MPQSITIPNSSATLDKVANLLDQASQLLREVGQTHLILSDQIYFWTNEWQRGEQAVDQALQTGEYHDFQTVDEAVTHLHTSV